ncbi:Fructokinase [Giardia muris]|uniref:Fructokinase n=1 Tax=Giardia muris TaxID=5742 RepID=A0A4Z1SXR5_GIAMU|nr:Fructokinase [Giardia muris]|eukprot:TNJ29605.1 Fructokinase [Giardia muris]
MIFTIGEVLYDLIATELDVTLDKAEGFKKAPGGAPANAASCIATLFHSSGCGGKCYVASKVGDDEFGRGLIQTLKNAHVCTDFIELSADVRTMLVFVSRTMPRQMLFYDNPCAHKEYGTKDIAKALPTLNQCRVIHFGSVCLAPSPMAESHRTGVKSFREHNSRGIVSYDPNVRTSLWPVERHPEYRSIIFEFVPLAHIIKVADDEIAFLANVSELPKGGEAAFIDKFIREHLFVQSVRVVLLTKGDKGAELYVKTAGGIKHVIAVDRIPVDTVDVTGAGDAFIGSFLYGLERLDVTRQSLEEMSEVTVNKFSNLVKFSNITAALSTTKYGGIVGMPTIQEVEEVVKRMSLDVDMAHLK